MEQIQLSVIFGCFAGGLSIGGLYIEVICMECQEGDYL